MTVIPLKKLSEIISKEYEKNPRNWQVLLGKGYEYFDVLITSEKKGWLLKLDTVYKPSPLGLGAPVKIKTEDVKIENLPEYGLRPASPEIIELLKTDPRRALAELEKIEPIPLEEARDYIIVGPLVQKSPLDILSEKQRKLSLKLEKELQKILKKEYYYIS